MAAGPRQGRIRIGVSSCLLGNPVRWDGSHRRDPVVGRLSRLFTLVPLCPEVEVGMGTPRPPVRLVRGRGGPRLLEPEGGRDHTASMRRWARRQLEELEGLGLSGFVLKSRSPSCGLGGVDLWPGGRGGGPSPEGRGLFAEALLARWPDLPVEEEGRLRDRRARREFAARVRARAARPGAALAPSRPGREG